MTPDPADSTAELGETNLLDVPAAGCGAERTLQGEDHATLGLEGRGEGTVARGAQQREGGAVG